MSASSSMKNINKWGEDTLVKTPKVDANLLEKIERKICVEEGKMTKVKESFKSMRE